ncbi:glycosyltransferase [Geomonas azotofigens]|uniref:glycosyltransferase n=1 Tax=Geomonas azotofigens TaxID=2843196 RepID=UPI001C11611B|nr:glycosyltransferase [Geomonas azotofigens]MBU5613387.1 glycosyltransferase [Geomonas azotofigens]
MPEAKVLHVIGGSQFGGIVPYVASLVKMAREQNMEAEVLATAPRVVDYYRQRGIKVVSVLGIDREISPTGDLSGLFRLIAHLRRHHYRVVHTHTSKGGIIGRLAAHLAGVPVIIHTTQGYAFQDYAQTRFMRWLLLTAERIATGWCHLIIAANKFDRDLAIETGIVRPEKIVTIKNCIDLDTIDRTPAPEGIRASLGLGRQGKVIGVMARLSPQKGLEYFFDALPSVLAEFPSVQVLVVGEGELLQALKARVEGLGLSGQVVFAGFRSDWIEVLRAIDLFVMPSLWEGLPITLLGAMATSRPIVTTRIKGITDVCGDGEVALLVEPANSAALSDAMARLLRDEAAAARYGAGARRRVEEEYSETVMNARIWNCYQTLLAGKPLTAAEGA